MTSNQLRASLDEALLLLDLTEVDQLFLIFVQFFPALAWHLQQWASSFGSETEVWLDFARERLKQSLFVHSEIIEFLELSSEVALASLGVTHAMTLLLAMQPLLRLLPHDLFAMTHN